MGNAWSNRQSQADGRLKMRASELTDSATNFEAPITHHQNA
jgi:hypothetical protein